MIIDCTVEATGHGKDVVDNLNGVGKQYLNKAMSHIFLPEEKHTENRMNAHTENTNGATSFVLEDQRLLQSHVDRMELFHISKNIKIE